MVRKRKLPVVCLFAILSACGLQQKVFAFEAKFPADTAQELGWTPTDESDNVCHGYYQEPLADVLKQNPLEPDQIRVNADEVALTPVGQSKLTGHVVIEQPERIITADRAIITRDKEGRIEQIDLYGHVRVNENGKALASEEAHMYGKNVIVTNDALYRFTTDKSVDLTKTKDKFHYAHSSYGWAAKVKRKEDGILSLHHATYTSCAPGDNIWRLDSNQIDLNRQTGRGKAYGVVFRVKDVPVAYVPYFDFPIDKRRQSGLLFPSFGNSTLNGFTFSIPYYWNIAPNYDATITPQVMSKRGWMMKILGRYLQERGYGDIGGSYLPHDSAFSSFKRHEEVTNPPGKPVNRLKDFGDDRWSVHFFDQRQWNDYITTNVDYGQVSDDYYFQDFGNGFFGNTINQLNQHVGASFSTLHWLGYVNIQHYQTLHPINEPQIPDPYNRMPQVGFEMSYPDIHGVNYDLLGEWNYFDIPHDPYTGQVYTSGNRYYLQPTVSVPIEDEYGYVKPTVELTTRQYNLSHQVPGAMSNITRFIPIVNIDSGLYFDRRISISKTEFRQTLEPRLYYLFAPYSNQNDIPNFDSALQPFGLNQLFRMNRFDGYDRIGDANQVTVALSSALIDDMEGYEKARLTVGQIVYFRNREVNLCNVPGCNDQDISPGNPSNKDAVSPLVGAVIYNVNPDWHITADTAWDGLRSIFSNANIDLYYSKQQKKIFDIGYHFARNGEIIDDQSKNLQQANLGFFWPVKERWGTIGALNYDFSNKRPNLYFAGLEYSSCCYAVRAVVERTFIALNPDRSEQYATNVYFQVLLRTLGNIGNNDAGHLLTTHIPGYQDLMKNP